MSSDPNQVNGREQTGEGSRAGKRAGDSLLSTIQEMQSRFDALREAHEQSERRERELAEREAALSALESDVRRRDEESARRMAEIDEAQRKSREWTEQAEREREEIQRLRAGAEEGAAAVAQLEARIAEREREIQARAEQAAEQARQIERTRDAVRRLEEQIAEREHVVAEQDKRIAERERRAAEEEKKNAAAEFRLAEQRQSVARELESLAERQKQVEAGESRIAAREQELESLKKRFAEQAVRVSEREEELEGLQRELEAREGEVRAGIERIETAGAALKAREEEIEVRLRAAAQAEERADQRRRELARAESDFADREAKIAAMQAAAAERERRIVESERAVQEALDRVDVQQRTLEELERGLADREREVGRKSEQIAERETVLRQKQADHASELKAARGELETMRTEIEQRDEKVRQAEAALRQKAAEVRRQADEVERNRVAVSEQAKTLAAAAADAHHGSAIHAGRLEQIQIQLGEANARRAATEVELTQARREIARLVDELRTLTAAAAKAKDSSRAEVGRVAATISGLEAELEEARSEARRQAERAERAELAAREAVSPELLDEQRALVDRLRGELKEAAEVNESLRQRAMDAGATCDADQEAELAAQVADRDRAIAELSARLDEAESRAARLVEEIELVRSSREEEPEGRSAAQRAGSSFGALRRERLRRYKALLQSQARKIVTAQSALQKRHADCEQVLAQRSKLAALAADLARREKKLAASGARSGAAAALLYAVATLAIIGVLSWQVAIRVWPGTYVASAVLVADTHGRTPTENELATWQHYHTELLDNPALMELAAERMARRGLVSLASPAELRSKLKKDLYHQGSHGELTVELKHEGADKARLILDTLVTAIKSVSDSQRDQRPDDLGVVIAQAATAGASPLQDNRLENAGMILGGASLAAAVFAMVVWSRLARAKQSFEHAQAVECALNEVDWGTLETGLKRTGAPGAGEPAAKGEERTSKRR